MEKFLDVNIEAQVKKIFEDLSDPVEIVFFSTKEECEYCSEIEALLQEVTQLSEKLSLRVLDLEENKVEAAEFKVDQAPVFILVKKNGAEISDTRIRFYGMPSGHEFTSLINDLLLVSRRDSGLSSSTRQFLSELNQPVHLQVFVTPTCPYCPQAVVLAHQMALESDKVTADMIEAMEFQEWASKFNVSGVPQTTINMGAGTVIGSVSEEQLVSEIRQSLAV